MSKEKPRHYESLGVDPAAPADQIKKAYRRKAMKHHPDRGGKREEFLAIQLAYDTLSDARKRAYYDAHGEDEPEQNIEQAARAEVCGLFMRLVDKFDPVHHNLIAYARKALDERERSLPEELKKLHQKIRKVESALSRLKHKGAGVNFLALALHAQVEQLKDAHEKGKKVFEVLNAVRKMIDSYEYQADLVVPSVHKVQPTSFFGMRF